MESNNEYWLEQDAEAFVDEVGYPLIAKPNIGVGAVDTWKNGKSAAFP